MPRGFDYKRRRDWPARGARREWPPLNVQDMDPTLLSNVNLTQVGVGGSGVVTWASFIGTRSVSDATLDVVPASVFSILSGTELSGDFPASAWTTSGGVGIRMPRDGMRAVHVTVGWDGNTTGERTITIGETYGNNVTGTADAAADLVGGSGQLQTLVDIQPAVGGNDCPITLYQDSGGSRTAIIDVVVVYFDGSGSLGGGGGGGATTLQETYASAFNSGVQTITTGVLTTIASTTFDPGNILSSDFVIGDWLDGTGNTIRFPRDGIATVQATVDWDTNTTGNRLLQYQSDGLSNVATTISDTATNFVADNLQVVTNQDIYSAGDHGLIQVKQDSGANRTCFVEWVVFYHAIVS